MIFLFLIQTMNILRSFLIFLLFTTMVVGQNNSTIYSNSLKEMDAWINNIYHSLTLEEKIGQLFMVAAYSNKNEKHVQELEKLVTENHIGGLIFFQGGPNRQAIIANRLQSFSKLPMLVGVDAEWGLSMRLDSTYRFPYNMTLGAVQDMKLIQDLGEAMAIQAKRMGIQFNFAPVVDVNTDPNNPIIGVRSYGETREIVTDRALAFMKGYQNEGLLATAKHFPGHGDTSTDSHHKLPVINLDKARLNKVELYPYKRLIKEGLSSVMVAHLNVPAYEPDHDLPSSLSYNIVTKLLKEELGFEGLIFTDALNMKAATNYLAPGEVDLAAFLAGNDLLLFSENVAIAAEKIKEAFLDERISEERLAYSVKKILKYKYKTGLVTKQIINRKNLVQDLNASIYDDLNTKLYDAAITLVKNSHRIIPFEDLSVENIGYLKLGDGAGETFFDNLNEFAKVERITPEQIDSLSGFTTVIVGYHKKDSPWSNHSFSEREKSLLTQLSEKTKVVLVSFAKPYALMAIEEQIKSVEALLVGYQDNLFAHRSAAQILFGTLPAKGELPVSISHKYPVGTGIKTKAIHRLGFSTPQNEGMNATVLKEIDAIIKDAINKKITPGAQILVARHGKVVYNKSFGYHSYSNDYKVKNTDLYDLASLTKILSTLPMVMKMYNDKEITLTSKLGALLPSMAASNKKDITLKDLLSHQAGLVAWLPFYKQTLDSNKKPSNLFYRYSYSSEFPIQVAENLYLKKDYSQSIINQIAESSLDKKIEYKYSDLGFILLKDIIENTYKKPLNVLVEDIFYKPMGATRLTYLPLQKFDMSEIPPTEEDNYYRYTTVQGYVHDMGAAMQGGVAGHAGLFGNALDVAKMMQMFLNGGLYGVDQFFSTSTFDTFNTCVYCTKGSRRGIGFDKPQLVGKPGPTCGCASISSFGHTGFTGTMVWADPEKELIYVFLSNRTYPDSNVNALSKENIRENIQRVIYESIEN